MEILYGFSPYAYCGDEVYPESLSNPLKKLLYVKNDPTVEYSKAIALYTQFTPLRMA